MEKKLYEKQEIYDPATIAELSEHYAAILRLLGEDPTREGLLKTPERVAKAMAFMAKGYAMRGLIDIVNKAGAQLAGIGVAVEKGFQDGGDSLRREGYPIKSLAVIDSAENGVIRFREDD